MAHYSDTTLSEPPLSPFSSRSLLSDGTQTSDEPADLGAFTSVFRVMNQLQQQQQHQAIPVPPRPDSRATTSEYESDVGENSTVWSQHPIASYLDDDETNVPPRSPSPPNSRGAVSEEEVERVSESSDTEGLFDDALGVDGMTPSLGDLDSTLGFLAAEKAKLAVSRLDGRGTGLSSTGESAWRHVVEPKRKRRRKRKGASGLPRTLEHDEEVPVATVVPTPDASSSSPDLSSPDKIGSSPPKQVRAATSTSKSRHSKFPIPHLQSQPQQQHPNMSMSPPSPVPSPHSLPTSLDPRLLRLRTLAKKLRQDFPQNSSRLKQVLVNEFLEHDLIDPRGPEPQVGDALTHVFIDHSNILIGFLNHVKRSRKSYSGKQLLSFPALALILERGRPISRRVLATSSPLYQNMDVAEDLGYSVHVYARVPDSSNGISVTNSTNTITSNGGFTSTTRLPKARKATPVASSGGTSSLVTRPTTESDPGQLATMPRTIPRSSTHSRSISATTTSTTPSSTSVLTMGSPPNSGRVRYREQGVDELLQLKLHQALVSPDADPLPPGATIVLATGDGASGQFNEDGFVGVVRTALNKGWMVELYAWGGGISGAWRKIAEEEGRARLKIWEMDPYVNDLLEIGAP